MSDSATNEVASTSSGPSGAEESLVSVVARRVRQMLQAHQDVPIEGLHPTILREVERALLSTVLEHTQGHREDAAAILGLHRNSLRRRLRALGFEPEPLSGRRPSRSASREPDSASKSSLEKQAPNTTPSAKARADSRSRP